MSLTPILTYHKIAERPQATIYPGTYVHPDTFRRHVAYLARHFALTSVASYLDDRPTSDRAVLTFDDGTADFAENALPILQTHGATGTVYLVTGETTNAWDVRLGDAEVPLMSPEQISTLVDHMEFGGHTRRHVDLATLAPNEYQDEIDRNRAEVEALTGRPCRTFCYPYGRTRESSEEAVRRAGYVGAVTTEKGANDPFVDPFRLRRIAVRHDTSLPILVYKLWRARHLGR